jgi:hypothetical protein
MPRRVVRPAAKVAACGVALLLLAVIQSLLPLSYGWLLAGCSGLSGSVFLTIGLVGPGGVLRED